MLADRLGTLVDFGVMERRPYREDGGREREEYVLTEAGQDLRYVLGALNGWGERHRPAPTGPASSWLETSTGEPVELRFVTHGGRVLDRDGVTVVRSAPSTVERALL